MFNLNLDFLKSFVGSRSYLGVDIGTASIKMVEISKRGSQPEIKNYGILESYGHLERANNAIQTSSLKIAEKETAEFLKFLINKMQTKSLDVIASIPAFSAFITLLEIPEMSEIDAAKVIPFQIRQHIPLPTSEVAIEWINAGKKEDKKGFVKQEILVISVPNEQIKRYKSIFKLAGLKLRALEIETLSLVRALISNDPTPTLLVDIGARSTNIAAIEGGFLKYNYQSDFAGSSLTQAISNGLNINIRRAEELKKQKGLLGLGGAYELSTLTIPFLDAIISEVRRVKDNYENNQKSKIERIILTGGGANLLGIEDYFEKQIELPIIIGNSFSKIKYPAKIDPFIKDLNSSFSVAIGLGIREFI
ncbi:type IV pilus assembly protein PilM [Candidatus Wolfebacteria bacterium]|nr:type IV pilus assembly protein PilM [Candidatus Wolfebacteria bacterium]